MQIISYPPIQINYSKYNVENQNIYSSIITMTSFILLLPDAFENIIKFDKFKQTLEGCDIDPKMQ